MVMGPGLQVHLRLWFQGNMFTIMVPSLRVQGLVLRLTCSGLQVQGNGFRLRVTDSALCPLRFLHGYGLQVQDYKLRDQVKASGAWPFGHRVTGSVLRVRGYGFKVICSW